MPRLQLAAFVMCSWLTLGGLQVPSPSVPDQQNPLPAVPANTAELPANAATATIVLADGKPIVLRNLEMISSANATPGQQVKFEVIRALNSDGAVVIPEHALALGQILSVEPKRRMGRGAHLAVAIESVQLANGETAPLRAVESRKAGGKAEMVGDMANLAVGSYFVATPLVPLLLLEHGNDVNIPAGTRFTAFLDGAVTLDRDTLPTRSVASPRSNVATIYVYRGNQDMSPGLSQPVSCGRELVGMFTGNQFTRFEVVPGRYWLYTFDPRFKLSAGDQKHHMLVLDAVAGRTYYVQVALVPGTWKMPTPTLTMEDEATGSEAVFNAESQAESLLPETGIVQSPAIRQRPKGVKADHGAAVVLPESAPDAQPDPR